MDKFSDLLGKTLLKINHIGNNEIIFLTKDSSYKLYHDQECCEEVAIKEIVGDFNDLLGSPLLLAEEVTDTTKNLSKNGIGDGGLDSSTWTFYKMGTIKGHVTITWIGSSNGYYSESVDFKKL